MSARTAHKVTIATLRTLERMAVDGVPINEAARRIGQKAYIVKYWALSQHLSFQPRQNRGMPAWMLPEAMRQAEAALRTTCERVRCHRRA